MSKNVESGLKNTSTDSLQTDKVLFIIRALPGAGKTTLANIISLNANVAADDYFDTFNNGEFNPKLLKDAHEYCREVVWDCMWNEYPRIAVHNTFTQAWEMEPYEKMAEQFGYTVFHIIVENRHGNESVHNVPDETIIKMKNRFEINL